MMKKLMTGKIINSFLLGMVLSLIVQAARPGYKNIGDEMDKCELLLKIIEDVERSVPIRKEKIESIFGSGMKLAPSSNESFKFWDMHPNQLVRGIEFREITISTKNNDNSDPGMITMKIAHPCFSLVEMRVHFRNLKLVGTPHGHSLDEERTYEQELPWARMVIGFAERNPDCMSSIGFAPHKLAERHP